MQEPSARLKPFSGRLIVEPAWRPDWDTRRSIHLSGMHRTATASGSINA